MTTKQTALMALVIVPFFMVVSGCYTQMETVRGTQYNEESDSAETDTTVGAGAEDSALNYYGDYDRYPSYRIGFSYYSPVYYWPSYGFYSSWYSPWYSYTYRNSFYGYYQNPYYYGHGYSGIGNGIRHSTRKFGFTRSNPLRRIATNDFSRSDKSDVSVRNRATRIGGDRRDGVPQSSFRADLRPNSRQSYTRNRGASRGRPIVSPRSNAGNQSRPPSFRPSRPSYSPPRGGGGVRGGSRLGGSGRGSGGSRGGGSRGGRR